MAHPLLLRALLLCSSVVACHASGTRDATPPRVAEHQGQDVHGDRYRDAQTGLTISKPPGWYFVAPSLERTRRKSLSLGNARLDGGFRTGPEALVVIVKDPHAVGSCTPTVKIRLMPANRGISGHDAAHEMVGAMQKVVPTFELRGDVEDGVLAGQAVTHFDAFLSFEVPNHQFSCDVLTHVWLIPRGDNFLVIGMSGPPTGSDSLDSEFAAILGSISLSH